MLQVLQCITNNSIKHQSFIYSQLNVKTVLFQTLQFSISIKLSSTCPIDRTQSAATTLSQSEPGSNGNEGVLCIPQCSSIMGASLSDCLVSYTGHSSGESYPQQRYSQCILKPQPNGARLKKRVRWSKGKREDKAEENRWRRKARKKKRK